MLSVKQGDIKYHFLSIWYDITEDWIQVSLYVDEHSNHHANVRFYLTHKRPHLTQPFQVKVDQGAMAMKRYSTFPRAPGLELHRQIV